MAAFSGWQTALLRRMGVPVTRQNLAFLSAWQGHEGGTASFNPLNTTQPWQGSSNYNSVGVKNYPNPAAGLAATIRTLRNGYYPGILAALRSGNPTWNPTLGKNLSTWGTGSSFMQGYRDTPTPPVPAGGPAPSATPAAPPVQQSPFQNQAYRAAILNALRNQSSGAGLSSMLQAFQAAKAKQMLRAQAQQPTGRVPANTPETASAGWTGDPVRGKVIGTPYAGTHTLGNWESDRALDVAVPIGTPIYAPFAGTIGSQFGSLGASAGSRFAGLRLHVVGPQNEWYGAHLSRFAPGIKPGVGVQRGQLLGYSGSAAGVAHLHEALKTGDPYWLIR